MDRDPPRWMPDWLPQAELAKIKEPIGRLEHEHSEGLSAIRLDRLASIWFPLPGQYPGEGYIGRGTVIGSTDRDGLVHYPLTSKLIVELRRKSPTPRTLSNRHERRFILRTWPQNTERLSGKSENLVPSPSKSWLGCGHLPPIDYGRPANCTDCACCPRNPTELCMLAIRQVE